MKRILFLLFMMHVGISTGIWQKAGSSMQVIFMIEKYMYKDWSFSNKSECSIIG